MFEFNIVVLVIVVFCSCNQNNAYVIPNAGNAGYGADSSVSDHQLNKKNPQSFFPDFPFDSVPQTLNTNDALFPANLPQFGMQFATNGLQTGLSTGYDIPFQSGNMIDPGGNQFRDIGQDMFNQPLPPNGVVSGTMQSMSQAGNQQPVFKTETFNITPDGQQVYENNRLVEESLRNPTQTPMTPQGTTQNVTPQGPNGTGTQLNTNPLQQPTTPLMQQNQNPSNPNYSSQVQQPLNPALQNQQPTYPTQMQQPGNPMPQIQQPGNLMPQTQQPGNLMPQTQQPGNLMPQVQQPGNPIAQPPQPGYQTQPNPVVKVASAGASTSTFISSTNGQPPQMAQNGGAYNYNYDSTQPQPVSGGYLATGGYTPNMNDPNQGTYLYTQGSFPTQQNPNAQSPNPLIPTNNQNFPGMNQQTPGRYNQPMFNPNNLSNTNYRQGVQNQQLPHQPPLFNNQQYGSQPGHFSFPGQIHQNLNRLNSQLSSLGMPHVDPSTVVAPITQFMQTFPTLVRNAANQGLQISKMPFDMLNAALDAFNTDLSNVRVNEFVQIPTEGGRAIVNSIEEMINQFQRNLQTYQVPGLARRSPEPWMLPNFDTSQMSQYYNSIPFGTAQEKINTMKSDILSKMQTPTFSQLNPFNYFSQPQMPQMQMPQMPKMKMPQMPQSSNGEPVVKVYSSSVSESTQSSSKNGGPPEISHQAAGYKYDYDSTKDNPVESDLVAMKGYTPDASNPDAGTYVAYENSYP